MLSIENRFPRAGDGVYFAALLGSDKILHHALENVTLRQEAFCGCGIRLVVSYCGRGQNTVSKTTTKRQLCFREKAKGKRLNPKSFQNFHTFSHFFRDFPPGLSPSKQRVLAQ